MAERLIVNPNRRLPTNASEQLAALPPPTERERILTSLFREINRLLSDNGIVIDPDKSTFRVKTEERIRAKIARRGATDPILDLYAMRFIMGDFAKSTATQLIRQRYPTPSEFPWGKPSFRDYSDQETKNQFKSRFNPNIDSSYEAIHINILFGEGEIANIAEIQLMTEQEFELGERMRVSYVEAQERMVQQK